MTHFPPAAVHERRRKILRYVGMALSGLMVMTVLGVFALIMRNESAHDEEDCPFVGLGERPFSEGRVLEQQRTCVQNISERRYLVERKGKTTYELARKRLASDRFADKRYAWQLKSDDKGRLVVTVLVDGKLSSEFREEDAVQP